MDQGSRNHATGERGAEGPAEKQDAGGYAAYTAPDLGFDPTEDLNLPASYEEVIKRFNRLQGDRAMEALN